MKEDWDHLAETFANDPIALIAEVDCTADEGQPICTDFDIQVRTLCLFLCEVLCALHLFCSCFLLIFVTCSNVRRFQP